MFNKKTIALLFVVLMASLASHTASASSRASIASRLFNLPASNLNYDYNAFGWNPSSSTACTGYRGGHSGLDMQTKDKSVYRPFYALASGNVIYAGGGAYNTIAIYNSAMNKTVLYLHARQVSVRAGQYVNAGTQLGYQGSTGAPSASAIHVHLEVRSGQTQSPSCGASYSGNPNPNFNPELIF
jgi:murein DD-endopeptidase MepM/ murein hydrolase activator NlpD